jgi:hypothetical protein
VTTPTPSASASRKESAQVLALQSVLDAEHAAVYGYGVVGARSDGAQQAKARASYDAHRQRRDEIEARIAKEGGQPHAAAAAYALPFPVNSATDASRLAVFLEDGVAAHYADMVAAVGGDLRVTAARWLQDSAVAAAGWRGASTAFPGMPERAGQPAASTPPAVAPSATGTATTSAASKSGSPSPGRSS